MISPNYILIFLIGFLVGAGLIAVIAWYLNFKKLNNVQNPRDELIALRTEMNTINNTIDSFKAAQELRAGTFNEQVRNLIDAGIKINDTANRFQNTLIKGGSQQQGALGELILKKILESIGFREGEEFETQKAFKDNDGKIQKPDVIVHMPGNRDIIIDSKMSLDAWDEYCNVVDKEAKEIALKKHIESVKRHIRDLDTDSYSRIYNISSPEAVMMFMPYEHAYLVVASNGKSIIEEAIEKKISIVGPSSLYYCLKIVEHIWSIDKQSKNAKNIANQASVIYDQAVLVHESFTDVTSALAKLTDSIDKTKNRLKEGNRSLIGRVEKLKSIGRLATKKKLSEKINDD
ncbi:MAG: hypothetical protein CMI90_01630 [Pelagibacteraceae bacterium]|nr:hypothetical protein [Pelagibacteraceae bacterium]|tara:strand:+ start:1508 stop:2545 length:1038 start_codon:yes stop_codon:yes gene_type:complete